MSQQQTTSLSVEQYSPTQLANKLGKDTVENIIFDVSEYVDGTITATKIVDVTQTDIVVEGTYLVESDETSKPETDSFSFAKTIEQLLDHPTCITGTTEGSPVWFENAAWCNNCHVLYNADDRYIGELSCEMCGSEFPRDGLMRATFPSKLTFREHISIERGTTLQELIALLTSD